jgi:hypothetical protein
VRQRWTVLWGLAAATLMAAILVAPLRAGRGLPTPSLQEISLEMSSTVEANIHSEHFTAWGKPMTVPDGHGGALTAVVGLRWPSADGYGQLLFFWHNQRFLGWDARYESIGIGPLRSGGAGVVRARFTRYAAHDPLCCPSLKPEWISFRWDGHALISSRRAPSGPGPPTLVVLIP